MPVAPIDVSAGYYTRWFAEMTPCIVLPCIRIDPRTLNVPYIDINKNQASKSSNLPLPGFPAFRAPCARSTSLFKPPRKWQVGSEN